MKVTPPERLGSITGRSYFLGFTREATKRSIVPKRRAQSEVANPGVRIGNLAFQIVTLPVRRYNMWTPSPSVKPTPEKLS